MNNFPTHSHKHNILFFVYLFLASGVTALVIVDEGHSTLLLAVLLTIILAVVGCALLLSPTSKYTD
jgi:hypothetical protein